MMSDDDGKTTVTVEYFAQLRERSGLDREVLVTSAKTASELYAQLQTRHGFALPSSLLKVAINAAFARWDAPIRGGDTIVFIPPVAGG
jgi:molybdopterin converting factor subunit 1